ncbi:hypothetical protein [Oleidesulfovibrio alaskensis]|jgi:hypothetical protein|nr:hypothetical protein [Oleidesulfovibrio alaskensis]MBG0774615.1 hypothetical protein [Oleidesulfovibrio alaskensis]MBL3581576.1 hypothetical protein [Oleidesulfovibrio alaskensis]MBL3588055.1 hypothetical protein [bacterium]
MMVPCLICGKDASTGWLLGLSPSPDSLKVALCAGHDTAENRTLAAAAWEKLMHGEVARLIQLHAVPFRSRTPYVLTVRYVDGGSESTPCVAHAVFENMALQVTPPEGAVRYYLLRYIKSFETSAFAR